jgi:CDP-glycerol glycerophosphotransferase
MEKEYRIRYPSLGKAFFLYQYFDNLISVSETVHQSNVERLTKRYNLKEEQFIFANNVIDFKRYQQLSKDPIDSLSYKYFLEDKRIKFINVARLSPEKGQERLIMAFIKVFKTNKNIALYIMGEGFLEQKLQLLIDKFHMGHNIILLGQQKNPYPFIKNATCMILPSFHEGQALVLLEALSLNIPCISTNIAGPRSVLKDGEGVLCDDTTEAIELSLKEFVNCELKFKSFSPVFYNEVALKMFNKNMRTKN